MTKSLTLLFAAVFTCGCASTEPAEQPVSLAMFFAAPYVEADTVRDEAYVRELSARECVSSEESESGRSRCH